MDINIELDEPFHETHYLPYIQFSFARLRPDIRTIQVTMRSYQDFLAKTVYACHFVIATHHGQMIEITDTQNDFDLAFKRALQRCVRIMQRRTSPPHKLVS